MAENTNNSEFNEKKAKEFYEKIYKEAEETTKDIDKLEVK